MRGIIAATMIVLAAAPALAAEAGKETKPVAETVAVTLPESGFEISVPKGMLAGRPGPGGVIVRGEVLGKPLTCEAYVARTEKTATLTTAALLETKTKGALLTALRQSFRDAQPVSFGAGQLGDMKGMQLLARGTQPGTNQKVSVRIVAAVDKGALYTSQCLMASADEQALNGVVAAAMASFRTFEAKPEPPVPAPGAAPATAARPTR